MFKHPLTLLLVSVLLITAQACAPSGELTPDPNAISTAIAQTVVVLTQTAQPGIPITGDESPTPSPSPELPSPTPSATLSPTPIFTPTPVVVIPQIRVSVPTNCRVGPGSVYQRVGALLVGEVAEVVGRHATRDYWVIRNPDRLGETCWLWGEYATVSGNIGLLPIYTPPPSPTPTFTVTPSLTPIPTASFTASYSGMESCTNTGWWVDIALQNTGGITFQSMSLTVSDTSTGTVVPLTAGNFIDRSGCNETNTRADLPTGATRIVSSLPFTYDLTGRSLGATITLCSNPGLNGTCRTQTIQFTP